MNLRMPAIKMQRRELDDTSNYAKRYRRGSDTFLSPGKAAVFQRTDTPPRTIDQEHPESMYSGQYLQSPVIESPFERSPLKKNPNRNLNSLVKLFEPDSFEVPKFPDL